MAEPKVLPMTKPKTFPVVEIFGPTMQGEGAMAGTLTHFVRFGGCDSRCHWCDSRYAVLPELVREGAAKLSVDEIVERIAQLGTSGATWVTLTGGNPALLELGDLVRALYMAGFLVNVETQGTQYRHWLQTANHVTVSPKPPSSGNPLPVDWGAFNDILSFTDCSVKIVVFDDRDLEYAKSVFDYVKQRYPLVEGLFLSTGTFAGGLDGQGPLDTKEDILNRWRWLVERVAGDPDFKRVRVGAQQHALLWGHGRGF